MDEATALLVGKHGPMNATLNLALRARKYGIWLGLGGQSWNASHIDTGIRDMLAARFMFRGSPGQSRVLIGESSASTIEVPGRAFADLPQRGKIEIQVPLIEPDEILFALEGQTGPQNEMVELDNEIDGKILELWDSEPKPSLREIQRQVYPEDRSSGGAHYQHIRRVIGLS
jgi:hypothetical protein